MKTLAELRGQYDEIFEIRAAELELPEERKTLKTKTFTAIERDLLQMCYQAKVQEGISERVGAKVEAPGKSYQKRKRGSWQIKGKRKRSLVAA